MLTVALWAVLFAVAFLFTLRLHQTGGARDRIVIILMAVAAGLVVAATFFAGAVHAVLMLVACVLLPLVLRPLAVRFERSVGGAAAVQAPAVDRERMLRLRRGELSLDQYFEEGHQEERDDRARLQALVARQDIAAVLRKYRVSAGQFYGLRQYLQSIPDLEWQILATPGDVERLIQMVTAGKNEAAIARAFRGRRRSS